MKNYFKDFLKMMVMSGVLLIPGITQADTAAKSSANSVVSVAESDSVSVDGKKKDKTYKKIHKKDRKDKKEAKKHKKDKKDVKKHKKDKKEKRKHKKNKEKSVG